jgi:flavin reductase (DIM6/NTAB) family NADH-FMN oxidoreductase RutF
MSEILSQFGERIDAFVDPVLWLVTARFGDKQSGLIATLVQKASVAPAFPRMLATISKNHYTWELIEQSRSFALHLFSEDQLAWVDRFGLHSGRDRNKFADLPTKPGTTGSPLLEDALLWIDCRVEACFDLGDRTTYLAEVVSANAGVSGLPLRLERTLKLLSDEQRNELKRRRAHDIALDNAAISAWRTRKEATTS